MKPLGLLFLCAVGAGPSLTGTEAAGLAANCAAGLVAAGVVLVLPSLAVAGGVVLLLPSLAGASLVDYIKGTHVAGCSLEENSTNKLQFTVLDITIPCVYPFSFADWA